MFEVLPNRAQYGEKFDRGMAMGRIRASQFQVIGQLSYGEGGSFEKWIFDSKQKQTGRATHPQDRYVG